MDIVKVVRALDRRGPPVQLIVLCGRHPQAAAEVRSLQCRIPIHLEGFTREVPYFMALADFFIGKPGPGSISEALAVGLPVVIERNAWTMVQERYNADWVLEREVGVVSRDFTRVDEAVRRLLDPARFKRYRANAAAVRNRAVFEIPEMLEHILARQTAARAAEAVLPGFIPTPQHA
jgi:1,2-diacylglycerol 3-beta-galactosyltransferase